MRLVLLMGLVGVSAWGQSFDCKLAKTEVEKTICASPKLREGDSQMAAAYKAWMAAVPADMKGEVLTDQRMWVRATATKCVNPESARELCLSQEYENRTTDLKARVYRSGGVLFVTRVVTLLPKDEPDEDNETIRGEEANPGFGTMSVTWPQAVSDAPEWKAWNAAVLRATKRMAGAEEKELDGPWKKEWAAGGENDVSVAVGEVTKERVVAHLAEDMMGHGAAHPNESSMNFHWMLAEKREMKVSDVFQPGSNWAAVVNRRCVTAVRAQTDSEDGPYGNLPKAVADVTKSTDNWTLEKEGLTISFPEYSVAPRSMPVDDVTVPWSVLKPYLAKGFVLPR